jgi:gluconokinase
MGVAGAGKTAVGRAVADSLGWTFLDADDFHPAANVAKMRAGVPLTDDDRAPWLAALRDLLERSLAADECVVLACSALKAAYREALIPSRGADAMIVVFLDVAPAVARERLAARRGHYMPALLVESQFAALEEPSDRAALRVDAALPVPDIVEQVARALVARASGE